ncbi:monocarboxylate transporter [Fusarium bulbicola]|nr:monocarboxylate transporter [Fusarium bulbicola]
MRVDNVDMGDTNDTERHAPPDATSSGEPFLDFDAFAFDPGTLESNAYESAFENGLEGNEFEFNFDDLLSADMTQVPLTADGTDFTQAPQLQGDTSLQHDDLQRPGTDQLALNFGDLMRNVSESPSSTRSPSILTPPVPSPLPPKIGHRFTLDAIRSLKDWFARNIDNPYPNEEEKNMLELQTGLTRTQITNWLANARRRRTTTDSGTQTASGKSGKSPSEYTPTRAGTPIPRRRSEKGMHPLQRWVDSPPENEPAAVSAIARAMASGELVTSKKALPPYLVELERGTPFPFAASGKPPDSPRSAYELITLELAYFISNHTDNIGSLPSHESLQLEACRIMFASEVTFPEANLDSHGSPSWFRDLLLSSDGIAQQARFAPIRSSTESRLSVLRVKGKNSLFEDCPLESRLQAFMRDRRMRGLSEVSDGELQKEAGRIVMQMESELQTKPQFVANWLTGFLYNSTTWISDFRRRADLMSADDSWKLPSPGDLAWSTEPTSVQALHDLSLVNDSSLFGGNDWSFGEQPGPSAASMTWRTNEPDKNAGQSTFDSSLDDFTWLWSDDKSPPKIPQTTPSPGAEGESGLRPTWLGPGIYVLNDPNHLPWFAREMKRWVKAAMSPNNPICHVPSDEELRHQARCLLYNDDDPWNQTPADHAQWLEMFKKEVGII